MTTLCPYCNGVLPVLAEPPTGEKLPCPRCGEPIPTSRWQVDPSLSAPPPASAMPERQPGVRKTALIILSIMLVMAVIGLSYALWTTKLRRSRDPKALLDPIAIRRPLELQGLGYLPKDSHVIVGLHIAEWLNDKKVGKPLLEEPRPALLDWIVKQAPRLTGMTLDEIDHMLLAASFDTRQVVLVVRTRRPYDLGKIAEHAKRSTTPLHQDKPLYEIALDPMLGNALLWCVEEKTLLCVIPFDTPKLEHLRALSATPRTIGEVLPAPLHEAMKERLPKQTFLWSVGRLDQLGTLKDMLQWVPGAKTYVEAVKDLKAFAIGLEPVEGLTLTGHFHLTDAKAAAKFKTLLEGAKIEGANSQKVETPPADSPDQWLTWQVRGDVGVMRAWLNQGQDRKK
jgi:hypothetical protein